ncbi:hypothetical protein TTHERM_00535390 (macronuclear) [Tetrahymena thermophila SB210]|uniref:Uncharacterized protein n=1 Tax=Tetrahymena thermophila (strain SB210) TaxID=312017 RepID=I7M3I3_TETTS|nr:hypothetical protein TTHERM_00535390 [Tetrahymena thermophila SB210]EAS03203.2 hypothetical protein TTHERM_00535390 [Tetrahymena thermophila SB210]|eukprot:XP_001023448.2 hypothetical protein TTHERM_00535390 [Tetrahymena thermophila SB210]
MINIEKQVEELYNNTKLQTRDFTKLELLDKQITSFIKKQDSLDTCQLNQISKISAKLLEIYFTLEEEYELKIYQAANENLEMQDEANDITLMSIFITGKISLETINFCFQMSLKCPDTDLKFTIAQLLDLLVINITYCRKLIDLSQAQKYENLMNELSTNNQVIFNQLFEELQLSEYLQNLYLCNQVNLLEMKSLSQKTKFSDLISLSDKILNLFNIYPMLNVSKQNIIENILIILFKQVQDCETKKVEEIIQMLNPISHIFQDIDISYYIHFQKLRLINALEHKDKESYEQLEKEFNQTFQIDPYDFFLLIINAKKLKIYQEEKSVQQIIQYIEDFSINNRSITSYEFSQLIQEICSLGNNYFNFALKLFQKYISQNIGFFTQQKKIQQPFYDSVGMICTLIDEFLNYKDHKKQINEVIEGLTSSITQIIGISSQIINIKVNDINNLQILSQKLAKLTLEIALNLNSLKEQSIQNALKIIEAFLTFSKNIEQDYDQSKFLASEISCIGLIFATKLKNQKYITDFSQYTKEFDLLPQLLQSQNQNFQICQSEFEKLLKQLLATSSNSYNQNTINLFLYKNTIIQIGNHKNLIQVYDNFIGQNFDQYVNFFTQNSTQSQFEKGLGISLCTPFVKKLGQLKQGISKNIEESLQILKMLSHLIDRFYQYYLTQDRDIPLNILILENERNELIQTMEIYFYERSITSDLSVSCKFLHFMILYFCLEIVFDNQDQVSFFEQKYFDQCLMKLLCYQQDKPQTQSQTKLFKNPQFFKSLTLLFSYQVAFYEFQLKQINMTEVQLNNLCNLIEKYELSCLNLICYEKQVANKSIDDKIKNQFFLFQYIFSILKNDVQKCLYIIEDFYQYYPDSLVLLSQISKIKQNQNLSYTINKKYIYYLSLQNYQSKYFSLELILDFVDQLDNRESSDSFYIAIKQILQNIIDQSLLQPSQLQTANFILKELISKLKLLNLNHPEISQLSQIQKRIKWK